MMNLQDQVPRVVPAVRAERAARRTRSDYFEHASRGRQPIHAAGRAACGDAEAHRRSTAGARPFGLDKLKLLRSVVPAVTHVDYSARVQTVDARAQPALLPADRGVQAARPAAR